MLIVLPLYVALFQIQDQFAGYDTSIIDQHGRVSHLDREESARMKNGLSKAFQPLLGSSERLPSQHHSPTRRRYKTRRCLSCTTKVSQVSQVLSPVTFKLCNVPLWSSHLLMSRVTTVAPIEAKVWTSRAPTPDAPEQ